MTLEDLIRRTRSTRRYVEGHPVPLETLRSLVDLARLAACEGNRHHLPRIVLATMVFSTSFAPS